MDKETVNTELTLKQCDLIALALDNLIAKGDLNFTDRKELNDLFLRFDTLSTPEDIAVNSKPAIPKARIQLIYDRDRNILPLFPK